MKALVTSLAIWTISFAALRSAPVPYAGKLSINIYNLEGAAEFTFAIRDANSTILWRNGSDANDTISVPVERGRYNGDAWRAGNELSSYKSIPRTPRAISESESRRLGRKRHSRIKPGSANNLHAPCAHGGSGQKPFAGQRHSRHAHPRSSRHVGGRRRHPILGNHLEHAFPRSSANPARGSRKRLHHAGYAGRQSRQSSSSPWFDQAHVEPQVRRIFA